MTARQYVHKHKQHGDLKKIAEKTGYSKNTVRSWSAGSRYPTETEALFVAAMKEIISERKPEPQY